MIPGIGTATAVLKKLPSGPWLNSTSCVSGLSVSTSDIITPTAFYIQTDLYLIAGKSNGTFVGWKWNDSAWVSDSAIISGLTDIGNTATPCVFYKGDNLYLISGFDRGYFVGWKWNGSSWDRDYTIYTSLGDIGGNSTPTVFNIGSDCYLIGGMYTGSFSGFKYNDETSEWVSDSAIISGLSSTGTSSAPHAFYIGNQLYMIVGGEDTYVAGYKWNDSAWVSDPGIISGLTFPSRAIAATLWIGGDLYLIRGGRSAIVTIAGYKY